MKFLSCSGLMAGTQGNNLQEEKQTPASLLGRKKYGWGGRFRVTCSAVANRYTDGLKALNEAAAVQPNMDEATNAILFLGDGMDGTTITAARILAGQHDTGASGEENFLSFERFPFTALAKTYNTNQQV